MEDAKEQQTELEEFELVTRKRKRKKTPKNTEKESWGSFLGRMKEYHKSNGLLLYCCINGKVSNTYPFFLFLQMKKGFYATTCFCLLILFVVFVFQNRNKQLQNYYRNTGFLLGFLALFQVPALIGVPFCLLFGFDFIPLFSPSYGQCNRLLPTKNSSSHQKPKFIG